MDPRPMPMQQKFYEDIFLPHLKNQPDGETLLYLYDRAFTAWTIGVSKEEIENMLIIQKTCNALADKNEKIVTTLITELWSKMHDERVITERCMQKVSSLNEIDDIGERYDILLEYYKTLFETELRMWLTLPYAYLCEFIEPKLKKAEYEDYILVPAGTKRYKIKSLKNPTFQGDFRRLSIGFDNKIRNAGKGHNNYEITDSDTLVLLVKHPKTHKVIERIELDERELKAKVKLMERKLWPLEMGIVIYLINNPTIKSKIQPKIDYKIKEIERILWEFVKQRQMTMKKFSFSKDRNHLELELHKDVILAGKKGGKLHMDGSSPSDIFTDEVEVNYDEQIMGIIEYALHLNRKNTFNVKIKVYDESNDCLMDLEFDKDEIAKLALGKKQKPKPIKGEICKKTYKLIIEQAIPEGTKDIYKKALDEIRKQKKNC